MSTERVRVTWRGLDRMVAHLYGVESTVSLFLIKNLQPLAAIIKAQAQARTNPHTGKLAAAIYARVAQVGPTKVQMQVGTEGVPYARAQEEGATYAPREILPSKAKALAFVSAQAGSAGLAFASSVQWPGATIPPKHFIQSALVANRQQFRNAALAAMQEAMIDPEAGGN